MLLIEREIPKFFRLYPYAEPNEEDSDRDCSQDPYDYEDGLHSGDGDDDVGVGVLKTKFHI